MKAYLIKNNFKFKGNFKFLNKLIHKNKTYSFRLFNNKSYLKLCNYHDNNKFLQNVEFHKKFSESNKIEKGLGDGNIDFEIRKKDEVPTIKENDYITNISLNNYYLQMKEEQQIEDNTLPQHIKNQNSTLEEVFVPDRSLSTAENFKLYREHMNKKEYIHKQKINYKKRVGICLFIAFIGLFTLWIPFYKVICESQGFSVKTTHQDYKFDGRKLNVMKKFTVKFIEETDCELPWEFHALQNKVIVNAGETCLAFYRARNMTDEPIIGLSVYDVHPQAIAMYFNKIQCFCFEQQLLGPKEEVDLPVFFYIDPAINDEPELEEYTEIVLKYSFYMAKKQDLAKVMGEHLKKEKEDQEKLKQRKIELNKMGRNYKIQEDNTFSGLPGINPALSEFYIQNAEIDISEGDKN